MRSVLPLCPFAPILGAPVKALWVDLEHSLFRLLLVLLQQFLVESQDVLALVVIDEVDLLQRVLHVLLFDGSPLANLVDRHLRGLTVVFRGCIRTAAANNKKTQNTQPRRS